MSNNVDNIKNKIISSGKYDVFFAEYKEVVNLINMIGFLREKSFNQIGSGTGRYIDIDKYDKHYRHVILWDNEKRNIAGSFRVGLGSSILKNIGFNGFYISSLFDFDFEIQSKFDKAIEISRFFIVKEYQKKTYPLFLLLESIKIIFNQNIHYEYLIGSLSLSNNSSDISKIETIEYLKKNHFNRKIGKYIHPKKQLSYSLNSLDNKNIHLPPLIKIALKNEGQVLGFNVDTYFNNTIDCLILLNFSKKTKVTKK